MEGTSALVFLAIYSVGFALSAYRVATHALREAVGAAPIAAVARSHGPTAMAASIPLDGQQHEMQQSHSSAAFIHGCYRETRWTHASLRARIRLIAAMSVWPVYTIATLGRLTAHNGPAIKRRTGKGVLRQIAEQLYVQIDYSIAPPWYYMFELHDDGKRSRAGQYLTRYETKKGVYLLLKRNAAPAGLPFLLNDKAAFAAWCAERGLPAIPTVMLIENGRVVYSRDSDDALPPVDLFVKPNRGKGGRGAERWDYRGGGTYRSSEGTVLTTTGLLVDLTALRLEGGCLVQLRAVNHPEIADLSNGALTTVRILTCRNEMGGIEVTNAAMRMARGSNTVVDNFHAGGIAAKVDIRTGELGRASDMGLRSNTGWCERHPDTGAQILGRRLPLWPQMLDVAHRAHAAYTGRIFVGWDVALLEEGPQLVEGNGAPDLDIIQRTHEEPLGEARFGRLLAFHLRQAL